VSEQSPSAPERNSIIDRAIAHFWSWGAIMLASGWLIGVSAYALVEWELADYLLKNDLEAEDRISVLYYGARGVLVVIAIYCVAWLKQRHKDRDIRPMEAFANFSRVWFVTLATPLLVGLFMGDMHKGTRNLALFFILIIASLVMVMVHMRPMPAAEPSDGDAEDGEESEGEDSTAPADPTTLVPWYRDRYFGYAAICCILYGAMMTRLSLIEHWSIATHAYDLGIYDNVMWNTTQGDWLGCSLCKGGNHASGHYDPILIGMSPLHKIWPRAETLLVFQAWWIAMAGLPLYLIARRALPAARGYCVVLVALFFWHPGLHGVNLFDFHSLALCVPLVLWTVHCIDANAKWWFPLPFALLLLVREDMPLISLFIGAYAVLRRRHLWGILTIVAAMAYLYAIKKYAMPDSSLLMQQSKDAASHIYYYKDMIPYPEEGMKGLVVSAFSNPAFTAKVIFLNHAKNFYIVGLLMPMLFLPLLGGNKRVLMLYGLAFIGLVTRKHVYSFHFQYSAVILPFLAASVPDATARVTGWAARKKLVSSEAHLRRTMMWGMIVATLLLSARFGAFIPNNSFKGGWNRLNRMMTAEDTEHHEAIREMVEMIPDDASVSASSSLVPHVSSRAEVFKYPSLKFADYALLNVKGLSKKKKHKRKLKSLRKKYETVAEHDGVELFRRTAPKPGEPLTEEQKAKKKADSAAKKKERAEKSKKKRDEAAARRKQKKEDAKKDADDDDESDDDESDDEPEDRRRRAKKPTLKKKDDDDDDDDDAFNPNND